MALDEEFPGMADPCSPGLVNLRRKGRQEVGWAVSWGVVRFLPTQREWARFTIFFKTTRFLPTPQSTSTPRVMREALRSLSTSLAAG